MSLPAPASNATVVITGASSGIGAELARELVRRGHHVTLVARRRDRLENLQAELGGTRAAAVEPCDLQDPEARTQLATKLLRGQRHVSGLANNAGFGEYGRFDRADQDRERSMVELNVDALHHLCGAVVPGMVERGEGAVLNLASTAAFQPLVGFATYAATKAFVHSFSEAVHEELAGTGVSVTSLCPGPTATEFGSEAGVEDLESGLPGFLLQDAPSVARAGIEGMEKGRRTVVPGVTNKASSVGGRFTPRTVLLPVMRRISAGRMSRG
jgi:short-subunit dehydrogenase